MDASAHALPEPCAAASFGVLSRGRYIVPFGEACTKYLIETWGCQMNAHDSEKLEGHDAAAGIADADLVILNTCSIREKAVDKVAQQFHNPGCHPAHEGNPFAQGRLGQLEEGWLAKGIQHVYPIQDQGMEVHIQVEHAAEPLHHQHRSGKGQFRRPDWKHMLGLLAQEVHHLLHDGPHNDSLIYFSIVIIEIFQCTVKRPEAGALRVG
jgi:hypothetical protein